MKGWLLLIIVFIAGGYLWPKVKGALGKVQMLLAAMVTLILGYSMIYSALHGSWAFWQFWFPQVQVPANT